MKSFVFPYKILKTSEIISGSIFDTPSFCIHQKSNPKCKQFYCQLKSDTGLSVCPYGFAAELINYGGQEVILTCLNIEKKSIKKEIQKRIKDTEFIPRISYSKYEQIKAESIDSLNDSTCANSYLEQARNNAVVENEKEALENAIHEIHNLTNQLTSRADKLSDAISERYKDYEKIDKLNKNIYALSNLMAIRLDSYKIEVDPAQLNIASLIPIPIYRKVEKAYKCLADRASKKNVRILLVGNSYNKYNAGPLLEIAFFIILENAIKYSPSGSEIKVIFEEKEKHLVLKFTNWSIRPNRGESVKRYTERGYRGESVKLQNTTEGRGIGLYLLNQICNTFGVSFDYCFDLQSHECFNHDGYSYSPFIIKLEFANME